VADITYIPIDGGFAYLSLLTDGYSRAIVGYALHPTLSSEGPLKALQMALDFYRDRGIDVEGVIHHSDRGIQYASREYTKKLLDNHARISMTQTGDPLHNALAERMNNTVKNGWLYECERMDFKQIGKEVDKAIYNYNWMRPHQAISMKTPMQMLSEENRNPLLLSGATGCT
jgi:transposase InsO family protein